MATTMNNMGKFTHVKASKRQSNIAGMEFVVKFEGTTDVDLTVPIACEVVDMHLVMTGAGASTDSVAIDDGTSVIITAVDVSSASDKAILRAAVLDDAKSTLAAGDTLGVTRVSLADADVYVRCLITE